MNRIKLTLLGLGFLVTITSCTDLDLEPESFLTQEEYNKQIVKDPAKLAGVASGLYNDLWFNNYGFCCRMLRYDTATSEIMPLPSKDSNMLYLYDMNPTTSGSVADITSLWNNFWQVIRSSNAIINNIPLPEKKSDVKKFKSIFAEAYFMRALSYFYLVRIFGDVPLVLTDEDITKVENPRVSVERVYNEVIIPDLEKAINDLPSTSRTKDAGTPSKWAAKLCLSDVYLTMGGWPLKKGATAYQKAADLAKDVVQNSGISLEPKYEDLWKEATKTQVREHMFAVINSVDNRNPSQYGISFYPGAYAGYAGWNDYFANPRFIAQCPDDDRKTFNYEFLWEEIDPKTKAQYPVTWQVSQTKLPLIKKYRDYNQKKRSAQTNGLTPVYRYADALLIYAEASTLATGTVDGFAADCLRKVQQRANMSASDQTNTTDPAAFDKAVFRERGIEFLAEGKRWFDYIRREKADEVKNIRYVNIPSGGVEDVYTNSIYKREGHYYLPIPQDQVQMAGWQNNKGY